MQDKASLGTRFSCYECGKKFYDLNRPEPTCPACGADQREDPTPDPRVAVMARYKGSRLTTDQTMPSKEQFKVDDEATEDGTADGATVDLTEDGGDDEQAADDGDETAEKNATS